MDQDTSHPTSRQRTRYLNIVYFIESARSHTIRINLAHARWAVGAAILVFSWAIASIFWITTLRYQISAARSRLETSLTTIFDYQIKNDRVFEIAYPADATNSYYSESAQLASNNPVSDKTKDKTEAKPLRNPDSAQDIQHGKSSEKNPPTAANLETEHSPEKITDKPVTNINNSVPSAATVAPVIDNSNATTSKRIDVKNAKLSKSGAKYSLVFDINNLSKQKAEGYIWTVASFASSSGQTAVTASPDHTKIDPATGDIASVKSAYRFSIQRFKNKTFDFQTPAGKDWALSTLKIHYTDLSGAKKETIEIPVDQISIIAAGPETTTETH